MNAPPTKAKSSEVSSVVVNVPNTLSFIRLLLSFVVFALLPWRTPTTDLAALISFLVAVSTDWIDGWWARKFNQITKVGRVLDPFVDKIIICGTFIILAAEQRQAGQDGFGIAGWMAVVVVGREMLVTALRSAIEQGGGDFSAKWSGKWKMVFQCGAVVAANLCLYYADTKESIPAWLKYSTLAWVWLAVVSTVYSGIEYIIAAWKLMLRNASQ
jgi:CDP-diacylglycerol--glycerol-3-phosphate 3-phosphatidyltransferase